MFDIIALDVGDKRVGVALGDSLTKTATPHGTFERAKGNAEREILALAKERDISKIIAGLPLSSENQITEQAEKVQSFCRRLERRGTFTFFYVDETLSTEEAKQRLNMTLKKERALRQRGVLDAVSASIILETFFAMNQSEG